MNNRQSIAKSLAIAVTTMTLVACGGGDSDTAPAVADPAAAATPCTPATSTSTFSTTLLDRRPALLRLIFQISAILHRQPLGDGC